MDPFTLISLGSTALRAFGVLKGGKTQTVVEGISNIIEDVTLPPHERAEKVRKFTNELSPELQVELKRVEVELAQIVKEREANQLASETNRFSEAQQTARVEAQSEDSYVRRTRPKIARDSAAITFIYGFATGVIFPLITAVNQTELPAPDAYIMAALFSPCLTYMGMRSVDGFSKKGKT